MGAMLLARSDGQALVIDLCDTLENMRQNMLRRPLVFEAAQGFYAGFAFGLFAAR